MNNQKTVLVPFAVFAFTVLFGLVQLHASAPPPDSCEAGCHLSIDFDIDNTLLHARLDPLEDPPPFFFYTIWTLNGDTVGNEIDLVYLFDQPCKNVLCATYPTGDFAPTTCTVCKAIEMEEPCNGFLDTTIICPEIYQPVCGCDGVTYDNACFAEAAGISSWHLSAVPGSEWAKWQLYR